MQDLSVCGENRMDIVATISQSPVDPFSPGGGEGFTADVHIESLRGSGVTIETYGWIPAEDAATVLEAAESSNSILSSEVIEESGDEKLLRIDWYEHRVPLLAALVEAEDVTVLGGRVTDSSLQFIALFETEADLRRFARDCREDDIDIAVAAVRARTTLSGAELGNQLTDAQLETLEYALSHGYYDVPRGTNVTEIADEFGVSDTAASQRMRRGLKKLLTAVFDDMQGHESPVGDAPP